jgi:phospholipase C
MKKRLISVLSLIITAALLIGNISSVMVTASTSNNIAGADNSTYSATPIKHIVVLFQENVSFDHYLCHY